MILESQSGPSRITLPKRRRSNNRPEKWTKPFNFRAYHSEAFAAGEKSLHIVGAIQPTYEDGYYRVHSGNNSRWEYHKDPVAALERILYDRRFYVEPGEVSVVKEVHRFFEYVDQSTMTTQRGIEFQGGDPSPDRWTAGQKIDLRVSRWMPAGTMNARYSRWKVRTIRQTLKSADELTEEDVIRDGMKFFEVHEGFGAADFSRRENPYLSAFGLDWDRRYRNTNRAWELNPIFRVIEIDPVPAEVMVPAGIGKSKVLSEKMMSALKEE